jgi:hypothetical protein
LADEADDERAQRVRVRLIDAKSEEQVEQIREGMLERDVWRNLDLKGPMTRRGHFLSKFVSGYYQGHLIVDADTDAYYGFFLIHCGRLKGSGRIEIDIAIPDKKHRKLGVSQLAFVELFDHWLLGDRCKECWGWIDVGNKASVRMIESLEIPVYNETERIIADEEVVPVIEVHMTAEHWKTVRPRLAERWGL